MFPLKALLNPKEYAVTIVAHPPLGAVTLWLLLLAVFWVLFVEVGYTKPGAYRNRSAFWGALAFVPPFFLAVWLLLTFLTYGMMRWIGHPLSFDALFCLLAFAAAPKYVNWLIFPYRRVSRPALYIWRTASGLFMTYVAVRLWETFSAAVHLNGRQTLLATIPALASLLAISLGEMLVKPASLCAAYGWRRATGKRVTIFYPPGKSAAEVEAIARGSDTLVGQIEQFLDVKALAFRIGIFLCASPEDLRRLTKMKGLLSEGYAFDDHICLIYGPWLDLKAIVAHELTHVVAKQRLNMHLMPLLNEGLAEYGMGQTVADSTRATICIPLPLGALAHSGLFYEWRYDEEPECSADDTYAHSAALVDYLVSHYGIEKFKELCRQTAYDSSQNQAAQLHKAVTAIYGISLQNLEMNWRSEWIGPGQIEPKV